jgi:hypothetical protein
LEQGLNHIIIKLAALEDFVFPHPFLPYGAIVGANPHCTHLQISLANPQTEIYKRVQF